VPREKGDFGRRVMYYGARSPLMELVLAKSASIHESHDANQIFVA
jgi:hypothetical protein